MIHVELLTPKGLVFEGEAAFVVAPSVEGSLGILPNHAPLIALLKTGEVRIDFKNGSKTFRIESGLIEVKNNRLSILTNQISD